MPEFRILATYTIERIVSVDARNSDEALRKVIKENKNRGSFFTTDGDKISCEFDLP